MTRSELKKLRLQYITEPLVGLLTPVVLVALFTNPHSILYYVIASGVGFSVSIGLLMQRILKLGLPSPKKVFSTHKPLLEWLTEYRVFVYDNVSDSAGQMLAQEALEDAERIYLFQSEYDQMVRSLNFTEGDVITREEFFEGVFSAASSTSLKDQYFYE